MIEQFSMSNINSSQQKEQSFEVWFNIVEEIRTVVRHWRIALIIFLVLMVATISVVIRFRPIYEGAAVVRLKPPSQLKLSGNETSNNESTLVDPAEVSRRIIANLTAKQPIETLILKYESSFNVQDRKHLDQLITWISNRIHLDHRGGNLYRLTARAQDPTLAQQITRHLAEQIVVNYRQVYEKKAEQLESFALSQVQKASSALKQLEEAMVDFIEAHSSLQIKSLDTERLIGMEDADRLRTRRQFVGVSEGMVGSGGTDNPRLKILLDKKRHLQRELSSLSGTGGSDSVALAQALAEAKQQLVQYRSEGMTSNHPLVKQIIRRINGIERKISSRAPGARSASSDYENKVRSELRHVVGEINKTVREKVGSQYHPTDNDPAALEAEWTKLRRRHQELTNQYTRLQEIAVNASLEKNLRFYEASRMATILENPPLPEHPIGLSRGIIIIAGIIGSILLGFAGAWIIGLFDQRLYNPNQVRKGGGEWDILAILPELLKPLNKGLSAPWKTMNASGESMIKWISSPSSSEYLISSDGRWEKQTLPKDSSSGQYPKYPDNSTSVSSTKAIIDVEEVDEISGVFEISDSVEIEAEEKTVVDKGIPGDQLKTLLKQLDLKRKQKWLDDVPTDIYQSDASQHYVADQKETDKSTPSAQHPSLIINEEINNRSEQSSSLMPNPSILKVRTSYVCPTQTPDLFIQTDPSGQSAEQLRLLAARLQTKIEGSQQVIAIASWEPQVGKTIVAANLALALVETQKRILLIDVHPGQASLSHLFGIDLQNEGICEQLHQRLDGSVEPWEVFFLAETLALLPASHYNRPAISLLSSRAFHQLLTDMSPLFDVIILDTISLQSSSDAKVLQQQINGYVAVVRRETSTINGLRHLAHSIEPQKFWGVVFNNSEKSKRFAISS